MSKDEILADAREKAAEVNKGNTYSSKNNRLLTDTLKRVLIQNDSLRLRSIIEAFVAKAEDGDMTAIKEIFDRMEGKTIVKQELSTADGSSFPLGLTVNFVKPEPDTED
jgi:hypothetical protein